MTRAIELLVRDRRGSIQGKLDFFGFEAINRWRDVGAWTVKTPNNEMGQLLATPGSSLVAKKGGKTLISGPMTSPQFERAEEDGPIITCVGVSDLVRLWDMLATPSPLPYNARANDIKTGISEDVIKYFVQAHCTDPMRTTGFVDSAALQVVGSQGRGITNARANARFDIVGDLVQSLAITGGLGLTANDLQFDVYEPVDRSREQIFSFATGNLNKYRILRGAPTCTYAITAGQGEGKDRQFRWASRDDEPEWGRKVERFFDQRNTDVLAELDQKNAEELEKGQATRQIAVEPIDRPDRTYGVDWDLGDLVTCERILSVITEVHVAYGEDGLQVLPTMAVNGNQLQLALQDFDMWRAVWRRVSALERAQ